MEFYYHDVDHDVLILSADGGLSASTAEQFSSELEHFIRLGIRKLIVDCSKLTHITSYGLGILMSLHSRLAKRGGDVKLASVSGSVAKILRFTSIARAFQIYDTVEDARRAFRIQHLEREDPAEAELTLRKRVDVGVTLNHYTLLDRLGRGGMGEVFLAEDTKLRRKVALKVLPSEMASDPDRRARFAREGQAVAALNHPGIVTVYSVEEDEGVDFITMELVEGASLTDRIPDGGLPLEQLIDLALPLIEAIASAHEQGVTHRDLKPANVLVGADDRVKVLDFGLAKLVAEVPEGQDDPSTLDTVTSEGRYMGTVPYMSPEQIRGKGVDWRTDIFSLGVLLYEMATGRHPFPGETSADVMSAILRDTPAPSVDNLQQLPGGLVRILERCLEKHAERRYQSVEELGEALRRLRAGEPEVGERS